MASLQRLFGYRTTVVCKPLKKSTLSNTCRHFPSKTINPIYLQRHISIYKTPLVANYRTSNVTLNRRSNFAINRFKHYQSAAATSRENQRDHNQHRREKTNEKSTSRWPSILICAGAMSGLVAYQLMKPSLQAKSADSPDVSQTDRHENRPLDTMPSNRLTLQEAIEISRDLVQRIKDESGSPGLVIAVSVDGETVWSEGLGYADVENRVPCRPETILRIASISKAITMATVAKLWENGDLDLDKPVQHYVPEFPEKTWEGEKVTLTTRQLLCHLSGIRHYEKEYMKAASPQVADSKTAKDSVNIKKKTTDQSDLAKSSGSQSTASKSASQSDSSKTSTSQSNVNTVQPNEMLLEEYYIMRNYQSVMESLDLFKDDPLVHKPGTKFLYTTHGWTLISAVVEKASGVKFETHLRAALDDFGMDSTFLEEHTPLIYNRGRHYVKNKTGKLVNAPYVDLSYKWAGGGLISNVLDLVKFGNIMLYSYQAVDSIPSNQKPCNHCNRGNDKQGINDPGSKTFDSKTAGNKTTSVYHSSKSNVLLRSNRKAEAPSNKGSNSADNFENKTTEESCGCKSMRGYLKAETMRNVWTPAEKTQVSWGKISGGGYGLGWAVWTDEQKFGHCRLRPFFVSHTGGAIGGSSVLLILPSAREVEESIKGRESGYVLRDGVQVVKKELKIDHGNSMHCKGVVVAIIVNMISVGLNRTAYDVARVFDRVEK